MPPRYHHQQEPAKQQIATVVDAAAVFGSRDDKFRFELEGQRLHQDTTLAAVWRPRRDVSAQADSLQRGGARHTAVLGFHREGAPACARVGPRSLCFCGWTFEEHSPAARLAHKHGFGWKNSLNKAREPQDRFDYFGDLGIRKWGQGRGRFPDQDVELSARREILSPSPEFPRHPACWRFRFMPSMGAETTNLDGSLQRAFELHRAKITGKSSGPDHNRTSPDKKSVTCVRTTQGPMRCNLCGTTPSQHDPEAELCPEASRPPYTRPPRFFESAWECVVCNRRWEEHETVVFLCEENALPEMPEMPRNVKEILDENTYGLLGRYSVHDHHGADPTLLRDRIAMENREVREILREEKLRGGAAPLPTHIDTTAAFRGEGKSMFGGQTSGVARGGRTNSGGVGWELR